jgi:hypothetical protein
VNCAGKLRNFFTRRPDYYSTPLEFRPAWFKAWWDWTWDARLDLRFNPPIKVVADQKRRMKPV